MLTISPSKTTFSPRMRKRPTHCSANTSWWYILSTVSSKTRLAESSEEERTATKQKINIQSSQRGKDRYALVRTELIIRSQNPKQLSSVPEDDQHLSYLAGAM